MVLHSDSSKKSGNQKNIRKKSGNQASPLKNGENIKMTEKWAPMPLISILMVPRQFRLVPTQGSSKKWSNRGIGKKIGKSGIRE